MQPQMFNGAGPQCYKNHYLLSLASFMGGVGTGGDLSRSGLDLERACRSSPGHSRQPLLAFYSRLSPGLRRDLRRAPQKADEDPDGVPPRSHSRIERPALSFRYASDLCPYRCRAASPDVPRILPMKAHE